MSYIKKFLLPLALIILGCAPHKETLIEKPNQKDIAKVETQEMMEVKVLPEAVREYAQLHQISDLKVAEFYLTHPEYAKANPYEPTEEDLMFYEGKFLEKMYPEFKKLVEKEGLALAALGRHEEAKDAFKRAEGLKEGQEMRSNFIEQLEANKWRQLYNEAHTAMELGYYEKAIPLFESAVSLKPDMLEAHVNLGISYGKIGDKQKQIYHLQKANSLDPNVYEVHFNLGLAYAESLMFDQAISEFKRAIELKPDSKDPYFSLGTALFNMDRYAEASEQFKKCIELSPAWFQAQMSLALCYIRMGKPYDAIKHLQEAIKINPNSADAHYNLGVAYTKMGDIEKASEQFRKALDISPGHRLARLSLKEIESYKNINSK